MTVNGGVTFDFLFFLLDLELFTELIVVMYIAKT